MKQIVFEECPYCHSKALAYGYQTDEARVVADVRGGVFGSAVQHTICLECGSIVYSRVVKPDFLKDFVSEEAKQKKDELDRAKPKKKKEDILEIIVDE
ncbi:MAG: hypothetical protein IJL63_09915 [Clostridia bacterium]|nr:hypothetical protein [Clostridia bacterium]